jgi:hypothetical protein
VSWLTCYDHFPARLTSLVNAFIPNVGLHFLLATRSLITGLNNCHAGWSTALGPLPVHL